MLSTLLLLLAVLAILGVSLLLVTLFLRLGLRWAHVPNVTWKRVLLTVLVMEGCRIAILVVSTWMKPQTEGVAIGILLATLLVGAFLSIAIIARFFQTNFVRSFVAWLATLIPVIPLLLLTTFIIKPYCVEAFKIVANSMAPTLIADHLEGVCPKCGQPNYCSAPSFVDPDEERLEDMICSAFHLTQIKPNESPIHANDRILVAKFLTPRRWDLLVFHFPEDPSMTYVKRLVGLPGETITIKEGKVYANDILLTPAADIQGIEYLSRMPDTPDYFPPLWGSADRPAVLAEDEYFVLGDFSARSRDSRLWEKGAAGHAPYAVPKSFVIGVATHLYWPLNRMRVFR